MIRIRSIPSAVLAAILLTGVGLLGACAPAEPLSEQQVGELNRFHPPYEVERTVHQHLVPINPTQTEIGEQQLRDLYGFLVGVGARPGDKVVLASREVRYEQRNQLERFINRLGLRPELRTIKTTGASNADDGYDNTVLVQYELYLGRVPDCGRWHRETTTNFYNTTAENFGCASAAALQQQIAYPSSLIRGEELAFPEGDVAAESVSRYRGRKVEAIKAETPTAK